MKRLLYTFGALLALTIATASCNADSDNDTAKVWNKYGDWRETNLAYYDAMADSVDADGKRFYEEITAPWNPSAKILIHYFNDRSETSGNLQPMLTSTCDVIYYLRQYNGLPVDSSYTQTEYGRAISRLMPQKTVQGFALGLMNMHVGDTVQMVMPYTMAYGAATDKTFPPFSTLVFNVRLTDIPYYEINN